MAKTGVLSLCFLVLFHGCLASGHHQQQYQSACQIHNLEALEPTNKIKAEAGVIETWEHNNDQLRCAGVTIVRQTIEPNGLLLPSFTNAPQLVYIVKGRGIQGTLIPGCPETYHSLRQQSEQGQGQEQSRRGQDQHQKIRQFRQGDALALPAGVAKWVYNDGQEPLVVVVLLDTSNNANQLDQNPRRFYLAGKPQEEHEQQQGQKRRGNVYSGLAVKVLAEAFGVSEETARKLQSQNDDRGNIVKVEGGLQVIQPPQGREEREHGQWASDSNGLEETLCSARLRENLDDPSRADIFTPHAGRISTLNSNNLPILRQLRLSAERGVMYKNAIYAPHYNLNAHSVTYVTKGRARVQIVNENGQNVFDGEVREGQVLVQPQNFVILKQASNEGFEYISFKTNDNAMINTLAGRVSAIMAMPVDVLANAYQISKEDASKLKFNREETTLFSKRSRSEMRDVA